MKTPEQLREILSQIVKQADVIFFDDKDKEYYENELFLLAEKAYYLDREVELTREKPFIVASVRDLIVDMQIGEISFSRMVEIMNEKSGYLPSTKQQQELHPAVKYSDSVTTDKTDYKSLSYTEGVRADILQDQLLEKDNRIKELEKQLKYCHDRLAEAYNELQT